MTPRPVQALHLVAALLLSSPSSFAVPPAEAAAFPASTQLPPAEAPASPPVAIQVGEHGLVVAVPSIGARLHAGTLLQLDLRDDLHGDPAHPILLVRKARLGIDGSVSSWVRFLVVAELATTPPSLLDGFVDAGPTWLYVRGGRFKAPLGIERLQNADATVFMERSLADGLTPDRIVGVQLGGGIDLVRAQLALAGSVPDGRNGDISGLGNRDLELTARVFALPFARLNRPALGSLGVGFAASWSRPRGRPGAEALPSYFTSGQQRYFSYLTSATTPAQTAYADGTHYRLSPQLYFHNGPVGVLAYWAASSQRVTRDGTTRQLFHQGWLVQASFSPTLDRITFAGIDDDRGPKHPLGSRPGAVGAFEVAFRYAETRLDERAFPDFADPTQSAHLARDFGGALNWYPNDALRASIDFDHTAFRGGAPGPGSTVGNRPSEDTLAARLQLAF